jgi:hypothetical protein
MGEWMSRTLRVIEIALVCMLVGCRRTPEPAKTPPPPVKTTATAVTAPPPAPPPAPPFIVAGPKGVAEVGPDGKTTRRLTAQPALQPRWLPGRKQLVFLTPSAEYPAATGAIGELRRVSAAGGDAKLVAKLPPPILCSGAEEPTLLSPQSDEDFTIEANGAHACLQLMDRNENMMEQHVSLRIDLHSGAIERRVVSGSCEGVEVVKGDAFDCGPAFDQQPPVEVHVDKPDDWDVHAVSRTGRWVVLIGNEEGADYIHFDALLMDVAAKQWFPIKAGKWPKPLASTAPAALARVHRKTTGVVGESDVRFLDGDLLVVDNLVVVPGQGTFRIDGDVAR